MKYRPHRELLEDAMKEVVELADRAALVRHLHAEHDDYLLFGDADVEVEWYCSDERIGWNTYIVSIHGDAVGFTDGPA